MYEEGAIPNKEQGIIIMGNEGNGISDSVRSFITHPLYIPSYKRSEGEVVESLNVSIATAIILAEFRR
jgi:TrmH family RNA methyltransferase